MQSMTKFCKAVDSLHERLRRLVVKKHQPWSEPSLQTLPCFELQLLTEHQEPPTVPATKSTCVWMSPKGLHVLLSMFSPEHLWCAAKNSWPPLSALPSHVALLYHHARHESLVQHGKELAFWYHVSSFPQLKRSGPKICPKIRSPMASPIHD